GSDQVWNYLTAGFDKSYFLDFVQDKSKKNSYAASFGVDSIPETYKKDYYKLLSDFQNISVREQQGADIVKDVLEVNPPVLLDPTLMLNREEWNRVSSKNKENAEYLLLYLIAESKSIISLAKRVAKERNLKIIYISDRLYKSTGMDNRSKVGVDEWVNLFLNASFIVTNSFHGVAFSINFQKEFYMQYLPGNAKVNSRLENILELTGLKDRFVSDFEKINIDHIDYSKVNKILQQEREKSIKYLKNV
ncbi:polysaccharide pyruvyl transferase family protein, partial [Peribacillus psychrosaccharolyticus]